MLQLCMWKWSRPETHPVLSFGYLGLTATSQDTPTETSHKEDLVGNNALKCKVKPSGKFPYMLSLQQQ